MLEEVRAAGQLNEPLHLQDLLHFSDLFLIKETQELALEETWETVSRAVSEAMEALDQMRLTEGQALAADLAKSLGGIGSESERIRGQPHWCPSFGERSFRPAWRSRGANRGGRVPAGPGGGAPG